MNRSFHIDIHGLLKLTAEDFVGQSVAVLGIKGGGKSNTAAVLMEEMAAAGIPICILDVAGEHWGLKERFPNITTIGRNWAKQVDMPVTPSTAEQIAETAYLNGASCIFDVSGIPEASQEELVYLFFNKVWQLATLRRIPLVIFLEEAHVWIPQMGKHGCKDLFAKIALQGRKMGLSIVMISPRSAGVSKTVLSQAGIAFLHRVTSLNDMRVYQSITPREPKQVKSMVSRLRVGEALALLPPQEGDDKGKEQVLTARIRRRTTTHGGDTPSLANVPKAQASLLELMQQQTASPVAAAVAHTKPLSEEEYWEDISETQSVVLSAMYEEELEVLVIPKKGGE